MVLAEINLYIIASGAGYQTFRLVEATSYKEAEKKILDYYSNTPGIKVISFFIHKPL